MPHNVFISYDLYSPGQNYETVIARIKSLGGWAKVHKSFWYLSTNYSYEYVAKKIWEVMDSNDSLFVVDTNTNDAYWYNLTEEVSNYLKRNWNIVSTV